MLIRLGYDIQFEIPAAAAMVAVLHVHPSRVPDLREPDNLIIEPAVKTGAYIDSYGNRCTSVSGAGGHAQAELPHPN